MAALAALTAVVAAATAYMQVTVPLPAPTLAPGDHSNYWQIAVTGALVVLVAMTGVAWLAAARLRE